MQIAEYPPYIQFKLSNFKNDSIYFALDLLHCSICNTNTMFTATPPLSHLFHLLKLINVNVYLCLIIFGVMLAIINKLPNVTALPVIMS